MAAKIELFSNMTNRNTKFFSKERSNQQKNTAFDSIAYPDHQTDAADKPYPIAAPYRQDRCST